MNTSGVVVHPWTESRPPTEAALRRQLEAEGLRPYVWANEPGEIYAAHTHPYHKVIIVIEGAILFGRRAGDRGYAFVRAGHFHIQ